ncbi:hypothetical protein CBL_10021 [Carabus blaptoides fortunei]
MSTIGVQMHHASLEYYPDRIEIGIIKRNRLTIYCYNGSSINPNTGCTEKTTRYGPEPHKASKWNENKICPIGYECAPSSDCWGSTSKQCFDSTIVNLHGPTHIRFRGSRTHVLAVGNVRTSLPQFVPLNARTSVPSSIWSNRRKATSKRTPPLSPVLQLTSQMKTHILSWPPREKLHYKHILIGFYRSAVKARPLNVYPSHFLDTGHNIDFDNTRTIASIQQFTSRIIREAIEIEKRAETLNTRDDAQRLPATWRPVLKQYNTTKTPRITPLKPPQEPPVLITQPLHQVPLTRSRSKKQSTASTNQNIRTTE